MKTLQLIFGVSLSFLLCEGVFASAASPENEVAPFTVTMNSVGCPDMKVGDPLHKYIESLSVDIKYQIIINAEEWIAVRKRGRSAILPFALRVDNVKRSLSTSMRDGLCHYSERQNSTLIEIDLIRTETHEKLAQAKQVHKEAMASFKAEFTPLRQKYHMLSDSDIVEVLESIK